MQILLLGDADSAAGLSWSWSAVGATVWLRRDDSWVKLELLRRCLHEGVVRRPKVISEDFLELAPKRAV